MVVLLNIHTLQQVDGHFVPFGHWGTNTVQRAVVANPSNCYDLSASAKTLDAGSLWPLGNLTCDCFEACCEL